MNDWEKKIIDSGHKITEPRKAVWKCLNDNPQLMSAREIHQKIGDFNQASVYRSLNLFEAINLAGAENIKKEKFYYSLERPHHHIICRQCGYFEDLPCGHQFNTHKNFIDIKHQLTLYGVCRNCAK